MDHRMTMIRSPAKSRNIFLIPRIVGMICGLIIIGRKMCEYSNWILNAYMEKLLRFWGINLAELLITWDNRSLDLIRGCNLRINWNFLRGGIYMVYMYSCESRYIAVFLMKSKFPRFLLYAITEFTVQHISARPVRAQILWNFVKIIRASSVKRKRKELERNKLL